MDRTLSDATTPGKNAPESDDNKRVLSILQSSSITGASPADCLVSYPGHSLGESYYSSEKHSVYFAALADWVKTLFSWLGVWVLWHINLCMLFNAKSIFRKIVLFQTIQFSVSTQLNCKYSLIVKNISISSNSI